MDRNTEFLISGFSPTALLFSLKTIGYHPECADKKHLSMISEISI
jgi:hypothetical protein